MANPENAEKVVNLFLKYYIYADVIALIPISFPAVSITADTLKCRIHLLMHIFMQKHVSF